MGNEYIYETENYGVVVGKSQSPENSANDVYQVVHKTHGVVEYETREVGQACFRCNVVQRLVDKDEWKKQWLNFSSSQDMADAQITGETQGTELSGDIADVVAGESIPGDVPVVKKASKVVKLN